MLDKLKPSTYTGIERFVVAACGFELGLRIMRHNPVEKILGLFGA